MIDNITGTATATAMTPAPNKPADIAKIHSAAQQFEALLIGELLKTSREAGSSGWLGTGDNDEAGQIGMEVGEQEFARMLAASGGLGLSKTIEAGMKIEIDIPDEDAALIEEFILDNQSDEGNSHGPLDMIVLAGMLMEDVAL